MTSVTDPDAWLRAELLEALEAVGYVGLYDAVWRINARLALDAGEARALAGRVVRDLLASPGSDVELRLLSWPDGVAVSGERPVSALAEEESWLDGDPYLAVIVHGAVPVADDL
jgi:hypothetical protein